jgi:hypothetical protein
MSETTASVESTDRLMRDYFAVMNAGGDLADFFSDDVTWINMESGEQFTGPTGLRRSGRPHHGDALLHVLRLPPAAGCRSFGRAGRQNLNERGPQQARDLLSRNAPRPTRT